MCTRMVSLPSGVISILPVSERVARPPSRAARSPSLFDTGPSPVAWSRSLFDGAPSPAAWTPSLFDGTPSLAAWSPSPFDRAPSPAAWTPSLFDKAPLLAARRRHVQLSVMNPVDGAQPGAGQGANLPFSGVSRARRPVNGRMRGGRTILSVGPRIRTSAGLGVFSRGDGQDCPSSTGLW
jgi:hypothetical protein